MPKHKCPFPKCTYETEDISDELAVVMITIHNTGAHTNTPAPTQLTQTCKVERVKRPNVCAGGSSEEWSYFITRWQEYAEATKIQGKEKVIQLLECCDENLRKDMTRNEGGSLVDKTADEVMAAIKKLAVRAENIMVARVELHNMQQDRDEPIRHFEARLRGQANICKFTIPCPTCTVDLNYTEQILRDIVTRGLADHEIQLDLLGDKNQDMSLEEVIQFIEGKEAGKRSAGRLQEAQSLNATPSQYYEAKRDGLKSQHLTTKDTCYYCGQNGHGKRASKSIRKHSCPAYGKTCGHCGRPNHIETVCLQKMKPKPPLPPKANNDQEGAIFESLCSTSCGISRDHHLYNQLNDCWVRQSSKPQPFITLATTVCPEDYKTFGMTPPEIPRRRLQIPVMADTGCQSCLASMKIIERFGLQQKDLIPVTMRMVAANNKGINILGATILRFSGRSKSGATLETRQITYVTSDSERLFLSREACVALGMISETFPTVGEASPLATLSLSDASPGNTNTTPKQTPQSALTAPCNCPLRQKPPPRPTQPPFPANNANRAHLQQWLLDYYAASTFNTCEHQPLALMHGPPMRLMGNPDATPVAHHTPIPVPLHWQEDVKAGLERDVALGVLEPVPIGEPVTWCHRMVVCAKKNGQPRRTVDFQALNLHATRETHHTQSPFHQARSVPTNKKKTIFDCWNGYHSVAIHTAILPPL
ncbi:Transposon Ty3-I Gag-Pol poly [Paramuricea clavata]|uniref:Transposon Ty3-I Gag-Pol poly, partial n=1 Tax=Paramuricea clavata TaxID=317549 RepID=A0A6S7JUD3_PARCT|nr:Transposon Ty3-I Gag-Pol poly [Paramuricea clavata]